MVECSFCKKSNPANASYCGYCGKKLISKPRVPQKARVIIPNNNDIFSNQALQAKDPFQSQYLLNIPQHRQTNQRNPIQQVAMIIFSPNQTIKEIKQKEAGWLKIIPWLALGSILLSNYLFITFNTNDLSGMPLFIYFIAFIISSLFYWLFFLITNPLFKINLLSNQNEQSENLKLVLAWSVLPILIRQLVRISFMVFTQSSIINPGLSGFFDESNLFSHYGGSVFQQIDIFQIWMFFILLKGTYLYKIPNYRKSFIVFISILLVILIRSLIDTVFWSFNGEKALVFLYP